MINTKHRPKLLDGKLTLMDDESQLFWDVLELMSLNKAVTAGSSGSLR